MHNVLFASDSVRSIDLTNVIDHKDLALRHARLQISESRAAQAGTEILRPILMLLRRQGSLCSSICISNNPLRPAEVDDLGKLTLGSYTNMWGANVFISKCIGPRSCGDQEAGIVSMRLGQCWSL